MNKTGWSPLKRKHIIGYRKSGAPIWSVGGAADEDPLERLIARQQEISAELEVLNEDMEKEPEGTPEQRSAVKSEREQRWKKLSDEFDKNEKDEAAIRAQIEGREQRAERVKAARAKYQGLQVKPGKTDDSDLYGGSGYDPIRSAFSPDARDHRDITSRVMRAVDSKETQHHLKPRSLKHIESLLRQKNGDIDGQVLGAYALATINPHYRSAFQKATGSLHPVFDSREGAAVTEVQALQRAMSVGTTTAGGFAVPFIIDPTVILTAQGSENDILANARVETITNDQWRGLTSAGVTWKFDAEAAPSNDNSPVLARPAIPTYRADGFIPYSIEIGQDWPGFAETMSAMLGEGYDELLADKLTNGTGANTPTGLVQRLLGLGASVNSTSATGGTIAPADIYKLWSRLPQRHRRKDTTAWMSSTDVQNVIRQFGTLDPNFAVNITEEAIPRLFGKRYFMNDYMPAPAVALAAGAEAIVGNMKGYLVAQRAGMNIEFVPMLFDVTNNRPTGQRGWFAYARVGADVVDPTAFQILVNKTS